MDCTILQFPDQGQWRLLTTEREIPQVTWSYCTGLTIKLLCRACRSGIEHGGHHLILVGIMVWQQLEPSLSPLHYKRWAKVFSTSASLVILLARHFAIFCSEQWNIIIYDSKTALVSCQRNSFCVIPVSIGLTLKWLKMAKRLCNFPCHKEQRISIC